MSLLALRISKDRLVENDDEPLMVVVRNEGERERGGARREPEREIDGTSR